PGLNGFDIEDITLNGWSLSQRSGQTLFIGKVMQRIVWQMSHAYARALSQAGNETAARRRRQTDY
ncbi:MAG: hypothetical protein E6559_24580, partial [Pantoea sp.]|nr:hypothetical protein [Pantoea sp.]